MMILLAYMEMMILLYMQQYAKDSSDNRFENNTFYTRYSFDQNDANSS